ncbi:ABC transporter ATP-binding protein [Ketogulonicigenium vulgare]|uniref:ABC transporter ATP-binding protein n=1 Tax=Ketogulonicigenium vulgare TaxID=92945 RepID=UPI0001E677AD|nr:ATP-binding cassette domain-containing protein [Ketogulonicigenium vulgare]ADO41449.1 ABC transporter-like protein [Ketogulonicigenium vulgare Y25]ANW32823.1 nickel ABC transporter ATP-binding protein [Ketogulonicigenium vulgare]AOZ53384.1 ABC transporter [Ketogulonicigenium vulgare]
MLEARALSATAGGRILFQNLSLHLRQGQIIGLCGPSGAGKTTLGRILAGLDAPQAGQVIVPPAAHASPVQYLHQTPLLAMNPRWRIARILAEAGPVDAALQQQIGVLPDWFTRFPHELSGGQLQRVAILRALGAAPRYLIADEITAALDPLAQVQIWQVLRDLAACGQVGLVAISHDRALLSRLTGNLLTIDPAPQTHSAGQSENWYYTGL